MIAGGQDWRGVGIEVGAEPSFVWLRKNICRLLLNRVEF